MAKKKISELPAGGALNGTELVPIVQTGTTKRITAQDIANLGNASGVEGSGTINYLAKFTATSTIGNSLIYDNGTGIGIGTTTSNILLRAVGDNNSNSRIAIRGYSSNANSSSIRVTKFRGNVGAPQAPFSGDSLGKFELAGYGTTSSDGYPQASFEALATQNWGATARGAKSVFKVTPNSTITQVIALTLNEDKSAVFESSVTASSLIKSGGTSAQYLKADGSVSTLTNPITGTGTTNYLPKFTGASALGNSIVSDNGTRVTIDGDFRVALADANINLQGTSKSYLLQIVDSDNRFRIYDNTANAERFTISAAGNVGIGTAAPVSYTGFSTLTLANGVNGGVLAVRNASGYGLNIYTTNSGGHIAAIDSTKALIFETNDTARLTIKASGVINIANIPTSAVGLSAGDIWSNLGILTIV
jgi:hypothetical protein